MRKDACFLYLIFAIIAVGCAASPNQPLTTANVVQITAPEGYTRPLIASWDLGDSSIMTKDNVSLAILGARLSASDTIIFYSLVGMDTAQFIKENSIEIIDDNGHVIELTSVVPLSGNEKFNLGLMSFGARPLGASELVLQIRDSKGEDKGQQLLICKSSGSPSEDRLDLTYSIRRDGGVELANYRIEMNLWLSPVDMLPPDTSKPQETVISSSGITPTPIQTSGVPWAKLPQDTRVIGEISFRVEEDQSKQVDYIDVQLLSDGSAITLKSGSVVIPTLIQLRTPTPTLQPYP
jgi:hypothetical protein